MAKIRELRFLPIEQSLKLIENATNYPILNISKGLKIWIIDEIKEFGKIYKGEKYFKP